MEQPDSAKTIPATGATSVGAKMTNVFVAPALVFDEIKATPARSINWLLPTLLVCLVGVIYSFVVFSQPSVMYEIREQKQKAIEKRLGNLPPAEKDRALEMAEKFSGPTMMKVFGSIGAVFGAFAWLVMAGLLVWLLGGLVLKAHFPYLKALEVCGLASTINILGTIIAMLLVVITGNLYAGLSPALLLPKFDPANPTHLLLSNLNPVTFWYLAAIAIGLARLSGISASKPAVLVFGLWAFFKAGAITLSLAAQRLFG